MWKKWHVNWNVSGGCNVNRRRFGERRPFQTEATVGKKDPRPERPSSEEHCKGKTQEVTPDRETETRLWRTSKTL